MHVQPGTNKEAKAPVGALSEILVESAFHVFEKCFQPRLHLDAEAPAEPPPETDGIGVWGHGLGSPYLKKKKTSGTYPGKRK